MPMLMGPASAPLAAVIVGPLMIGAAVLILIGFGALYLSRGSGRRALGPASPGGAPHSLQHGTGQDTEQQVRDPRRDKSVEQLRREAGSMLMEADQAIRSSEQEVLFAQASYGEEEVAVFRRDIEESTQHLSAAFRAQHEFDREPPADEEQAKDIFIGILDSCQRIHETLESHREEFESLRDLENRPGPAIEQLSSTIESLRTRLRTVTDHLSGLSKDFAEEALAPLRKNLDEAQRLQEISHQALDEARAAVTAGDSSAAVVAIHRGEESIDDAAEQVSSAESHEVSLREAHRSLERELGQTEQDIAQAEATLTAGQAPELAGPVAAAKNAVARIRHELQEPGPIDPLDLLAQLESAHRELDEPLNSVRDRHARDRRARESLETELLQARHQVQSSLDFLRSRRMRVSAEAQARMSEAQRCLTEAVNLREEQPSRALDHAQQAKVLAVQAAQIAETADRERAEENIMGMGQGFGARDHGGRYFGTGYSNGGYSGGFGGGPADGFGRGYGGGISGGRLFAADFGTTSRSPGLRRSRSRRSR